MNTRHHRGQTIQIPKYPEEVQVMVLNFVREVYQVDEDILRRCKDSLTAAYFDEAVEHTVERDGGIQITEADFNKPWFKNIPEDRTTFWRLLQPVFQEGFREMLKRDGLEPIDIVSWEYYQRPVLQDGIIHQANCYWDSSLAEYYKDQLYIFTDGTQSPDFIYVFTRQGKFLCRAERLEADQIPLEPWKKEASQRFKKLAKSEVPHE